MLRLINRSGNTYTIQDSDSLNNIFYTAGDCRLALERGINIEGLSLDAFGKLISCTQDPILPANFNGLDNSVLVLAKQMIIRGFDLRNAFICCTVVNKDLKLASSIISEIKHSSDNIRTLEFSEGLHCSKLLRVPLNPKQKVKIFSDLEKLVYTSNVRIKFINLTPSGIIVKCYFVYVSKKLTEIVIFRA